jgi:hypothetical protein
MSLRIYCSALGMFVASLFAHRYAERRRKMSGFGKAL